MAEYAIFIVLHGSLMMKHPFILNYGYTFFKVGLKS